ncbi:hypothetical protein FNH22_28780 [Fulvivirga sp. M361]|uniref:Cbp1 family collagen-binding glycoprotein adhesin n=1 Tax=Fulvivirga sp. M361 TaxID=2594266 RepID=UPI00117B1325|nr:hypothetical protein [Fulvivirga sp. M361]TRX48592.1 hypothetical protein FNH22_28780 [Fulvivirga sp. M361]
MKLLKKYGLVLMLAPIVLACNQKEMKTLSSENKELDSANHQLESELETYMRTFNEIESNLAEIKERESAIALKTQDNVEYEGDAKQVIVDDIKAINALLVENHEKMAQLQSTLNTTNGEFKKMVGRLNQKVKEKDQEVVLLKEELTALNLEKESLTESVAELNGSVETLEGRTMVQDSVISAQTQMIQDQYNGLTTAFVAIGTYKDLEEKQVLQKEGGLLGLGRTEKLNEDPDLAAFTRINIDNELQIDVQGNKAELVTNHPKGSYKFEMNETEDIEKLVILDKDDFWRSSKMLVVMVNE